MNTLSQYPDWRYCNVTPGDKKPMGLNWQNNPLTLEQVTSSNIGLLLGPYSNGVIALDFDGTSAWSWFSKEIGCDLPETPIWTSGKQDRCQMAFTVNKVYWDFVKPYKVTNVRNKLIEPGEGFEFRWHGGQSVMPPSTLDDGRSYTWINDTPVIAQLPDPIMAYWLNVCNPVVVSQPSEVTTIDNISDDRFDEVIALLTLLRQTHPNLDYETWRTAAWGVAKVLGVGAAKMVMQQFYPNQVNGEYDLIFRSYDATKSPGLGSIKFLIGPVANEELTRLKTQSKLEKIINEAKEIVNKWQP